MTENKRFTVDSDGKYFDRLNNRYLTTDNLLNELNELNNENKELKLQLGECRHNKLFSRRELEKENNELKQLLKKVIDERVIDYPLLCKLKEMVEE